MKNFWILLVLTGSILEGFAQSWTGAVSSAWNSAGNWDTGVVPTASSTPYIGTCTTCPTLSGNVTVAGLNIEGSGSLGIGTHTLTVNGVFAMNGGNLTANNGTVRANRVGAFMNSTFTGSWKLQINMAGTNSYLGAMGGGNTFNNDFTLEAHTGDWTAFIVANSMSDVYKGKTILKNIGTGWLMIANNPGSNTIFEDDVEFINAHADEGKIQIGAYGGKIQCEKKAKIIDNTSSPYSYISIAEALFKDETTIETKRSNIAIGTQGSSVFKKTLFLKNTEDAVIGLGSASGGVVFESAADLSFVQPMKKGHLLLQQFDFQNSALPLNLVLDSTATDTYKPNTLIRLGYWGTFDRVTNITADYIQYNMVTFNKKVTMRKTGISSAVPSGYIGWGICPGSSTFKDTVIFNNSYGDDWILSGYNPDVFKKDVFFHHGNHGWGVLRPSYSGNTTYEGNIYLNTSGSNGVVWGENGGTSTLVAGKKITTYFSGNGWLNLANFTQLGTGNAQVINIGAGSIGLDNVKFNSKLTLNAARVTLSNSQFFDSNFTKTGNGIDNSIGQNTFWQKINIKNTSTTGEIRFITNNSFVKKQ